MRITILGSGAMACLFGARLAPHAAVTLLGTWREGIAAIAERGIQLDAGHFAHVYATTDPRRAAPADLALVLVKSWQTARAASQAAEILSPAGVALTLQNGLGNLEMLEAAVGSERAALGVTTQGATLVGPGVVREGGRGPVHVAADSRLSLFTEALRAAGFEVHQSPLSNLESLAWGKLVVNCGINALTAILRVPNGELLLRPDASSLMDRAAGEAADVARAKGIVLPYADPVERVREVARATAANRSSMLQDVMRGAPTEIDAINGAVVREGARLDVLTPINEVLSQLVRALDHEWHE